MPRSRLYILYFHFCAFRSWICVGFYPRQLLPFFTFHVKQSLRTLIGCRLGNKSLRIYLRQTKLTLQLWTKYGFILSLSHKIPEPPFCKIFASLLYRLHMFFQVSFQDRVLVSLFYQSKLLFSKDSTSIVPHLYIIAVNGELVCP